MKKLILSLVALSFAAFGQQAILTPTTLSTAISDGSVKQITVTSATGAAVGSYVFVDRELMEIQAVNSTVLTVRRAAGATSGAAHASGALAFIGTATQFFGSDPQGACTRANELVLPRINTKTGMISDCLGGSWMQADISSGSAVSAKARIVSPETGGTAYTSLNTNGTATGATTLYCTEFYLPSSKLLTGIALLNGTTVGTDKHYVVLYDSTGKALANSSLAGTTSANASTYQTHAFTSTYFAIGPAQYFACAQSNGTTDTIRMVVTGTNDNVLTKGQTGATFGTVPSLTVPTTFTTAVGPYVYVY